MQFTANADNFREAYKLVSKAVGKNNHRPILEQVFIDANDRRVLLYATDNEVTICAEVLGCKVDAGGVGLVSPALMKPLLKALKDGEVDVKRGANGAVTIGGAVASAPEQRDALEYPARVYQTDKEPSIVVDTADFAYALNFAQVAASTDEGRPNLTGVHLTTTARAQSLGQLGNARVLSRNEIVALATDGHRMNLCSLEGRFAEDSQVSGGGIIIPAPGCDAILSVVSGAQTQIAISGGTAYLHTPATGDRGSVWVAVRLIDANFPDFTRVIPSPSDKHTVAGPFPTEDLREAFTVMAKAEKAAAKFLKQKEMLRVSVFSDVGGIVVEAVSASDLAGADGDKSTTAALIPCAVTGKGGKGGYNPQYWVELGKAIFEPSVEVTFIDALSPTLIYPETKAVTMLSVVMPMRL